MEPGSQQQDLLPRVPVLAARRGQLYQLSCESLRSGGAPRSSAAAQTSFPDRIPPSPAVPPHAKLRSRTNTSTALCNREAVLSLKNDCRETHPEPGSLPVSFLPLLRGAPDPGNGRAVHRGGWGKPGLKGAGRPLLARRGSPGREEARWSRRHLGHARPALGPSAVRGRPHSAALPPRSAATPPGPAWKRRRRQGGEIT